jgi:hypothetical protein
MNRAETHDAKEGQPVHPKIGDALSELNAKLMFLIGVIDNTGEIVLDEPGVFSLSLYLWGMAKDVESCTKMVENVA